jgi:uncharacterized protein YbaR (Trm112 family)
MKNFEEFSLNSRLKMIEPKAFSDYLCCPDCKSALSSTKHELQCEGCGTRFPSLNGIPWLFKDPDAELASWQNRCHHMLSLLHVEAEDLKNIKSQNLLPLTSERLQRVLQAKREQGKALTKVLAPLNVAENRNLAPHIALRSNIPESQGFFSYYDNIFRDWCWGQQENQTSYNIIEQCLGEARDLGVAIIYGAGACRQIERDTIIYRDDTIRTGSGAKDRLRIRLQDRFCAAAACPSIVNVSRDTELAIQTYITTDPDERSVWEIITGSIRATFKGLTGRSSSMQVRTGTTVCGIRGTTYIISYDAETGISIVAVQEGLVSCTVGDQDHDVEAMEKMTVSAQGEVAVDAMALGEWIALERETLGDLGQRGDFAGTWSSTYGKQLVLTQSGDEVSGSYDTDNGRVVFRVAGSRTLDGYWIEDASGVECGSAREGRDYWGRLILEFDEALSGYVGSWGYCDADTDRGWYGSRIEPD